MPISSDQARQNALIGGGRPKGSLSPETKLKIKAEKVLKKRIYKITDKLFNAQAVVALGSYKMVVKKVEAGIISFETVRDDERMQDLLDNGIHGQDYLILAGAIPEWKAADALLNRAYGKAKESLALDVDVKFSLKGLAERRKQLGVGEFEVLPVEENKND